MNLLPDERGLQFNHLSEPVAAYRVDSKRLGCSWMVIAVFVVMSVLFVGIGVMFMGDEETNKTVLALVVGAFVLLWLGLSLWMFVRMSAAKGQRVLLYPEGIVVWREGEPRPYLWSQIKSMAVKRRAFTHGEVGRVASAGRELECTLTFDGDKPLVLNGLLSDLDELIDRMAVRVRLPPGGKGPKKEA